MQSLKQSPQTPTLLVSYYRSAVHGGWPSVIQSRCIKTRGSSRPFFFFFTMQDHSFGFFPCTSERHTALSGSDSPRPAEATLLSTLIVTLVLVLWKVQGDSAQDSPFCRVCVGGVTLRAQDSSRLRIQSLLYRSQGPLGKDYFRTTLFFPTNFVTLLAVI